MVIQSVQNCQQDDQGGILVFAGLSLAVVLGMAAMVFDMGRMATTQTELQTFADNVALAAAGELDGQTDSITRAILAAATLTSGRQTFGQGNNVLAGAVDYSLCFAETLPEDDLAPITCLPESGTALLDEDQQRLAAYVEVTVTPRDVDLPFARVFAILTDNAEVDNTVSAVAVAGFVTYACDVTPLMFCMPDEDWTSEDHVGQSVFLRSGGTGAAWGPGNFGFLDVTASAVPDPAGPCADLSGVKLTACMIAARSNINACFTQRGVDTEPGQKVGIENAIFNTRFDMFNSTMSQFKSDRDYAPGPHVAKGFVASNGNGTCVGQSTTIADTMAFPPDQTFNGRFGEGDWDIKTYIDTNHGPVFETNADGSFAKDESGNRIVETPPSYMYDVLTKDDGTPDLDLLDGNGDENVTRHEVYLEEIRQAAIRNTNGEITSYKPIFARLDAVSNNYVGTRAETGGAQCSPQNNVVTFDPDHPTTPDRRIFVAAAIDCDANPISGKATNVPVKEFVKIFLTQPVGESTDTPPNFEFYVEVVGTAGGLGNGTNINGLFNDVVQLYR